MTSRKKIRCLLRVPRQPSPPPAPQAPARGAVGSLPPPASAVSTRGQDPRELGINSTGSGERLGGGARPRGWLPGACARPYPRSAPRSPLGARAALAQQPTAVRARARRKWCANGGAPEVAPPGSHVIAPSGARLERFNFFFLSLSM